MAYASLREFVDALERAGELRRVKVPVDVELEITEIADRSVKSGGPALLFEKPVAPGGHEYDVPVLINAYASDERMKLALGVDSMDAVADEVAELLEIKPPEGIIEKVKMLPKLARLASFSPEDGGLGPVSGNRGDRKPEPFFDSRHQVLARGRGPLYHLRAHLLAKPEDWPKKRRALPRAVFSTRRPRACTCTYTTTGRRTFRKAPKWARAWRWR